VTGRPVPFLDAPDSGYLPYENAQETVISPAVVIGERIWFRLLILRHFPIVPFGEYIAAGGSQPYCMVVTNEVMPLVGLESFSLTPEQPRIIREGNQVIVEWQHLAAWRYGLQATGDLHAPIQWLPIFEWSGVGDKVQKFSVTNAVTTTPRFYRLEPHPPVRFTGAARRFPLLLGFAVLGARDGAGSDAAAGEGLGAFAFFSRSD
jgi:hypothetical protein